MRHEFKKIEPKWQKKWAEQEIFKAVDGSEKPKFYGLVEFPYPSGAGMHVGHIKAYSSIEVIARKRRMEGYNVLSESFLHLLLWPIFCQLHPNFINVHTVYASEIWAQLTKNLLAKSSTKRFREYIMS